MNENQQSTFKGIPEKQESEVNKVITPNDPGYQEAYDKAMKSYKKDLRVHVWESTVWFILALIIFSFIAQYSGMEKLLVKIIRFGGLCVIFGVYYAFVYPKAKKEIYNQYFEK